MLRGGPQHLGSRGRLAAGTGREVWNFTTMGERVFSISVSDNVVYARTGSPKLYAVDMATGGQRWNYTFSTSVSGEATVAEGLVFFARGSLIAFDPAAMAVRWEFDVRFAAPSPAIGDGTVYLGTSYHEPFYALDAATGRHVWNYALADPLRHNTESPSVYHDGAVYVGSSNRTVRKFDAATGRLLWEYTTVAGGVAAPAVWNGTVFIAGNDPPRHVIAVDAATGKHRWTFEAWEAIPHAPVVANGTVYVYDWHNMVQAVDAATGKLRWEFHTPGSYTCRQQAFCRKDNLAPAVLDGVIFVVGHNGKLYALDGASGTELWNHTLPGEYRTSPIVVNNTVYVGVDRSVLAIEWGGVPPRF